MSELKVTFTAEGTYLHARIEGDNTPGNVLAYAAAIMRECEARGCHSVLVEEALQGPRLNQSQVFKLGESLSERLRGFFRDVAYVDVIEKGDLMPFAEDVLANRGLPMRVFSTVAEARQWLEAQGRARRNGP